MNNDKIDNVISHLRLFSDELIEFREPAAIEEINSFETKYGVHLPDEYKYLLSKTNGLSLMADMIFGIFDEHQRQRNYDLNRAYEFEHFECCNPMPLHLVPFCPDGFGNHYCFDTIAGNVVFWQWDYDYTDANPEVVYSSLSDLIQEIFIDWTLKDTNYDGSDK